jgi:hypothetical protein
MNTRKQLHQVKSALVVTVYDGREIVGRVVFARDGYEARDPRGHLVGRYGSAKAAMAALPVLR